MIARPKPRPSAVGITLMALLVASCAPAPGTGEVPATGAVRVLVADVPPENPSLALYGWFSGEMLPCSCRKGMGGGIPRAVARLRKVGAVVLVGPLLTRDETLREVEANALALAFAPLAVIAYGASARDAEIAGPRTWPIVTATGDRDYDGILVRSGPSRSEAAGLVEVGDSPTATDGRALARVRRIVEVLRTRADRVLLVSGSSGVPPWARDLAREGLADRIVCGADPVRPVVGGEPDPFVRMGGHGDRICLVSLPGTEAGPSRGASVSVETLDFRKPSDPLATEVMKDLLGRQGRILAVHTRVETDPEGAPSRSCAGCHAAEYAAWRSARHANAWSDIPELRRNDPRCISCHTSPSRAEGMVAVRTAGISCRVCHVVSEDHGPDGGGVATRTDCRRCHTKENSPEFELDEYRPKLGCLLGH